MKRILSLLLTMILVLGAIPVTAFGASAEKTAAADTLYDLGLFSGTGTDTNGKPIYDLDRAPTRNEAITMLVTLLGKKEEAMAKTWTTPFTDVAAWAKPFVGYAYANGLTSGTSKTTFGGNDPITVSQYLTFVLKVLGYKVGPDFQWNKAWELSDDIGLTDGRYDASTTAFTRGDVVLISEKALSTKLKGSNVMLMRKLYNLMAAENWEKGAKNIDVNSFNLPEAIGNTTLTYDQAYALVGQDPEVIQAAVKTVGDLWQYMVAANFRDYEPDVYTPWYGERDNRWGFDAPGHEQVLQNYGCCCGGCANFALFLLKEDYEEMGIVRWVGGGNHTINYLLHEGKYYIFDVTNYLPGKMDPAGTVTVVDQLEDYYDVMPTDDYPRDEIAILVAIQDVTVNPPSVFGKDTAEMTFPKGYEEKVKVLYPANNYSVTFKDVTIDIPMWNTEELDIPATHTKYDTYEDMKEQYKNEKFDLTMALVSGGFAIQEDGNFRSPMGSMNNFDVVTEASLIFDGYKVVSDYTVISTDPTIFECTKLPNGKLQITGKQPGKAKIILTYKGRTSTIGLEIFQ